MKNILIILILCSQYTLASSLNYINMGTLESFESVYYGGESSGGGGSAIVCFDKADNITSVEMLDTYEGRVLEGMIFPSSDSRSYEEQVDEYVERLRFNDALYLDMKAAVKQVKRDMSFLPQGVVIHTPSDLENGETVIKPKSCEILGVGYYEKNGILRISTEIFNSMSEFQKAAFIFHEAIYALHRYFTDFTLKENKLSAAKARKFTALVLSNSHEFKDTENFKEMTWPNRENNRYAQPLFTQTKGLLTLNFTYIGPENLNSDYNSVRVNCYSKNIEEFSSNMDSVQRIALEDKKSTYQLSVSRNCKYIGIIGHIGVGGIKGEFFKFYKVELKNELGHVVKQMNQMEQLTDNSKLYFNYIFQPIYYLN